MCTSRLALSRSAEESTMLQNRLATAVNLLNAAGMLSSEFIDCRLLATNCFREPLLSFSNAASPARSSDAETPRHFSSSPGKHSSARNTISRDGRHHRSTSGGGCASDLQTCNSIVRRSCSTNFAKTNFRSDGPNGTHRKIFHAATTSMRQWLRVIGVTVVRLENQYFPTRIISVRMIRQDEIDGGGDGIAVRIETQQSYKARCSSWACARSCESRTGSARNSSAFRGCCVPAPPPPCLMNERPVRRIHQADDAVIHAAGQFRSQDRRVL